MDSPPLTPAHSHSQRRPPSQRSSSFSSVHSLSVDRRRTSYARRRSSNASRLSAGFDDPPSPSDPRHRIVSHAGTLADELDSADDDDDDWNDQDIIQEEASSELHSEQQSTPQAAAAADGTIDSTIGRTCTPSPLTLKPLPQRSNLSRPSLGRPEQDFSPELELAINDIAAMAQAPSPTNTTDRTACALRDLTSQTSLETFTQRLASSTTSTALQLLVALKTTQSLTATLFSPLTLTPLTTADLDELLHAHTTLMTALPNPDLSAGQQLAKLHRDTTGLQSALSALLDSLQMSKQASTVAARHLKGTHGLVAELLGEYDRAEEARCAIERGGWDGKLGARWCAGECREVVAGFEGVCAGLRREIELGAQ